MLKRLLVGGLALFGAVTLAGIVAERNGLIKNP